MATVRFRDEEIIGLGAAAFLHVGLLGVLLLQPDREEEVYLPERVTVSLAEDVGLEQVAPEIVTESRASMAPTLADQPLSPEVEQAQAEPETTPERAVPKSKPKPKPRNQPRTSSPRPKPKPSAKPKPKPRATEGGSSRLGSNFLEGQGSSTDTADTRPPASKIGRQAKASLLNSIQRQVGRHWDSPEGVDAEKLSILVSWRLNEDGRLAGAPKCKPVRGVTPSNRTQANVYCRYATTAIRRAAPFNLPDRYYNAWKSVKDFQFDGEL